MASVYTPYIPSPLDQYYMSLARDYRLRMKSPEQSSFRVICILTYNLIDDDDKKELRHVIGCNIESTSIRASICGERCALFNLVSQYPSQNFVIQTAYILTDASEAKCSGLLCLEFLSSFGIRSNANLKFVNFSPLTEGNVLSASLCKCYPFPPIYKYLVFSNRPSNELYSKLSKHILGTSQHSQVMNNEWPKQWRDLYVQCLRESEKDSKQFHPLSFGGGALFANDEIECCAMDKALEYGASIECITKLMHTLQVQREKKHNRPLVIMIVDSFGILHAPNAVERTALIEHGFGETKVAIHYHTNANPKQFYQFSESFEDSNTRIFQSKFKIFIKRVKDIVPAPPDTQMLNDFVDSKL